MKLRTKPVRILLSKLISNTNLVYLFRPLIYQWLKSPRIVYYFIKTLRAALGAEDGFLYIKGLDKGTFDIIVSLRGLRSKSTTRLQEIGLTTGRAIVLIFTGQKGIDQFINELMDTENILKVLREVRRNIEQKKFACTSDIECILAEEYLHWEELHGTSILALIDGISWAIRIQQIAIMKEFHEVTRFPRKIGKTFRPMEHDKALDEINKYNDVLINFLKKIDYNNILKKYFKNIQIVHFYILPQLRVFLEPLTWAALGLKIEERINNYFPQKGKESRYARRIYKIAKSFLGSNNNDVSGLVALTNRALDVPAESLREHIIRQHVKDQKSLLEVFLERFEKSMSNGAVEVSADEHKTHFASYLIAVDYMDYESLKIILDILRRHPSLFQYITDIISKLSTKKIYNVPSFFIFTKDEIFVYDPLTGIEISPKRRRVPVIAGLEDIVGDLPMTLRGFIFYLWHSFRDDIFNKYLSEKIPSLSIRLGIPEDELKDLLTDTFEKVKATFQWQFKDLRDMLNGKISQNMALKFFKSWLYVIHRLGWMSKEILTGLHAMYD
jgi:hypothetical protein